MIFGFEHFSVANMGHIEKIASKPFRLCNLDTCKPRQAIVEYYLV
jgi:hypothetical protein